MSACTFESQQQIDTSYQAVADYNKFHAFSKPLFFDTKTTGGGKDDQIIEIAFCDSQRNIIIDTLIYTERPSIL